MTIVPGRSSPGVDQGAAVEVFTRQIDGDVSIVHQPIVDLARGTVVGFECLARFADTCGASVEEWFALAARTGGIGPRLEATLVDVALRSRPDLPPNCFLTVNVSPSALLSAPMSRVFSEAGPLGGVVVELTEHAPVQDLPMTIDALDRLRAAGAQIAVDDAGAGYAGLKHLLDIQPDMVKLDRAIISGIDRDEAKRALVEMLGVFADRVDAWILAEGIETESELDAVLSLGVPLGQGWALGRPDLGWPGLSPSADGLLRARSESMAVSEHVTVRSILQHVRWIDESDVDATLDRLRSPDVDETTVVLDAHRRPVRLLDAATVWSGGTDDFLRVNVDTPVDAVARRMMTRSRGKRLDPALVVDAAGRFVGAVSVERVVARLSRSSNPRSLN